MVRPIGAVALSVALLSGSSGAAPGRGQTPALDRSACLRIMASVRGYRASSLAKTLPLATFVSLMPGVSGVKQDEETVRFPGYTFQTRTSLHDPSRVVVSLLPDERCGGAWFADESGTIYEATRWGCSEGLPIR